MPGQRPLLVRGGAVLDGSGRDPVAADVRVREGLVTEVRPGLTREEREETVDAAGLVLSPGFVDMHSHSDLYALVRPADGAA
ncbi:MAG: D-aminoacylase, partial [Nitriliruptorales bacterium]